MSRMYARGLCGPHGKNQNGIQKKKKRLLLFPSFSPPSSCPPFSVSLWRQRSDATRVNRTFPAVMSCRRMLASSHQRTLAIGEQEIGFQERELLEGERVRIPMDRADFQWMGFQWMENWNSNGLIDFQWILHARPKNAVSLHV